MSIKPDKGEKKSNHYMKYAGLGFQMAAIFFIGIYGGQKLDAYFGNESPGITISLIFFLFIGYMVKLYKELN
jgi:hypothetical protein